MKKLNQYQWAIAFALVNLLVATMLLLLNQDSYGWIIPLCISIPWMYVAFIIKTYPPEPKRHAIKIKFEDKGKFKELLEVMADVYDELPQSVKDKLMEFKTVKDKV